jgi:type IV pilus assembly protein PilA
MKTNKKIMGFTLVEVIVVAVIVAVLAAVAVPLYLNYVKSSKDNVAQGTAGDLASFCGACINSSGSITSTGSVGPATVNCTATSGNTSTQVGNGISFAITAPSGTTPGNVVASSPTGSGATFTRNY